MSVFTNSAYLLGNLRTEDHLFFNKISQPYATTDEDIAATYGGSYPVVSGGSRIASNVLAKNPLMTKPNVAGMRYFGQNPISKVCMDQDLPKRIGQFPTPQHGSGMNCHDFNTNPVYLGAQSVGSVTGAILYGPQFKKVAGASKVISGSLASIAISALTNILNISLPSSMQSSITGLSSILGALNSLTSGGSGGSSGVASVFRLFSAFSFSDPVSSLLSSSITGAITSSISGGGLIGMSSSVTSLLGTAQSYNGSLSSISPAYSLNSLGNGTFLLQNAIDQAIESLIPGSSMIVSSTLNSLSGITALSGASAGETLNLQNRDSNIAYSSAAAQTFANQSTAPFSNDIYSQGFTMAGDVGRHITSRNSKAV
jgi:hypothetical protein